MLLEGRVTSIILLASLLIGDPVLAQSVQQSGTITRNHITSWNSNGVVQDGGTSADSPISSFGATNSQIPAICANSARQSTNNWLSLCLGFVSGQPTITVQNNGLATPQPLQFIVNGITYPFPALLTSIAPGSTPVNPGTSNGLLYNNGGVVGNTNAAGNAIAVTSAGGVPSMSTTAPSGLTLPAPTITGAVTLSGVPVLSGLSSGTCSNNLVINASNQIVTTGCPVLSGAAAGGDLSGTYPNPTVAKINGTTPGTGVTTALGIATNTSGGMITNGATAGADLSGTLPSPTVAKVNGNTPGGTCTNQFVRSISSSAVPTCNAIANADMPAYVHGSVNVSAQTGFSSVGTFKMVGYQNGVSTFTPAVSGKMRITVNGYYNNGTSGDGCNIILAFNSGTGPANQAAATGTQLGSAVQGIAAANGQNLPFSLTASLAGFGIATAYWVDLQMDSTIGGTCTAGNATITYDEMP